MSKTSDNDIVYEERWRHILLMNTANLFCPLVNRINTM